MKPKERLVFATALAAACFAATANAQERRELGAHVHGVSALEVAVEEGEIVLDLYSPGVDIVGFEHEATSAEDKDAVEAAIVQFTRPSELFVLDEAAGCRLIEVLAHLHTGDEDHEHADAHVGAAHGAGEDHAHDEDQAAAADHDDDHAEGEAHDEAEHSEFHARYRFACENPEALQSVQFPFFDAFPNAGEIEAKLATASGASEVEIDRGAPSLSLN